MIVSNGVITRNIAPEQLPEYESKGYKPVVVEKSAAKIPGKKGAGK